MRIEAINSVNSTSTYISFKRINQRKIPLKNINNNDLKVQRYSRNEQVGIESEFKLYEVYSEKEYRGYKGIYGQFVDYLV